MEGKWDLLHLEPRVACNCSPVSILEETILIARESPAFVIDWWTYGLIIGNLGYRLLPGPHRFLFAFFFFFKKIGFIIGDAVRDYDESNLSINGSFFFIIASTINGIYQSDMVACCLGSVLLSTLLTIRGKKWIKKHISFNWFLIIWVQRA